MPQDLSGKVGGYHEIARDQPRNSSQGNVVPSAHFSIEFGHIKRGGAKIRGDSQRTATVGGILPEYRSIERETTTMVSSASLCGLRASALAVAVAVAVATKRPRSATANAETQRYAKIRGERQLNMSFMPEHLNRRCETTTMAFSAGPCALRVSALAVAVAVAETERH